MARAEEDNWSEAVEDLVTAGDTDAAIALLESVISNLENTDSGPELGSALCDLANLYSSKGFSLKADTLQCRASLIKLRLPPPDSGYSLLFFNFANSYSKQKRNRESSYLILI